jgi:hypothetical protein
VNESEWVPVEGFVGYSINPLGQVRNDESGRILHIRFNEYNVPYVGMVSGGRQYIRSLPRLVALTFVPQPNRFFDTPVNLDGDRTNNHATNLVWRPRKYAVHYLNQFKEKYDNAIKRPVRCVETREEFPDSISAACTYGLLEREVVHSVLNRTIAWPTYQRFELVE